MLPAAAGGKRPGPHLGDGVDVQEQFTVELALLASACQGDRQILWTPEAWGLLVEIRPWDRAAAFIFPLSSCGLCIWGLGKGFRGWWF